MNNQWNGKPTQDFLTRAIVASIITGSIIAAPTLMTKASAQTVEAYRAQISAAIAANMNQDVTSAFHETSALNEDAENASLTVNKNVTVAGNLYGGSIVENSSSSDTISSNITKSSIMTINGTIQGVVYGGGYANNTSNSPNLNRDHTQAKVQEAVINVNDGASVGSIFGGGKESYTLTSQNNTPSNSYDDFAVNTTGNATVTKTTININGGTVSDIAGGNDTQGTRDFGGKVAYKSDTTVEINVNGGTVNNIRSDGGQSIDSKTIAPSDAHVAASTINLNGGKVTGSLNGIGADDGSTLNIAGKYTDDDAHLHAIWGFKNVNIKKDSAVTIDASTATSNKELDSSLYAGMGHSDNNGNEFSNGNTNISSDEGSTLILTKPLLAFHYGNIELAGQTNIAVTTNTLHQTAAIKADEGSITIGSANLSATPSPESEAKRGSPQWADAIVADNSDSNRDGFPGGKIVAGGSDKKLNIDGNIVARGKGSQIDLNFGKGSTLKNSHISAEDGGIINIAVKDNGVLDLSNRPEDVKDQQINSLFAGESALINLTDGHIVTSAGALQSYGGKINIEGASVKLSNGDTFTDAVKTYPSDKKKYVVLNQGILQAPSWTIFEQGLGSENQPDGKVTDPKAIRPDTAASVKFSGGTVILDDDVYNLLYLQNANTIIKSADGGTTNVAAKDGATIVTPAGTTTAGANLSDVTNDGIFIPVNAGKASISISDGGDSSVNTFNAKAINLNSPNPGENNQINVAGKTLALGGTSDSNLITIDNAAPSTAVPLSVTDNGSLVLGITNTANTLAADIRLGSADVKGDASNLTISAGTSAVNKITANQSTNILVNKGATLKSNSLALKAGSTLQINGTLSNSIIDEAAGSTINIGSDTAADTAGTVSLTAASKLSGATVFLDPVWKNDSTIADSSKLAYENTALDYNLVIGQNSVASLGTANNDEAQKAFSDSKLTWGENAITAALYLAKPITLLNTASLYVDGSRTAVGTTNTNTANFAANSLLMVNGAALTNNAAITAADSNGVLTVDKTAKLYITNAKNGTTYKITDGFIDTSNANGWYTTADNIILNKLFTAQVSNGAVTAVQTKKSTDILPNIVLNNIIDTMPVNSSSTNAGIKYLSNALEGTYSDAASTQLINTAAQPAEVAGATASSISAAMDFADTAQQHLSYNSDETAFSQNSWVKYSHTKDNVHGLPLAGMDANYKNTYNGIVIGYDFTPKNSFHSGFAFSYGDGNTGASLEHNTYSFWGGTYYGGIKNGQNQLLFDMGYSQTKHDVKGLVNVSPRTDILTAGISDEYRYHKGNIDVVPHIGLRYLRINTPSYNGTIDGNPSFHYDPNTKNLYTLPIGIGFTSSHNEKNGWKLKVNGDFSYINILGSRTNHMSVSVPDVNAFDNISYDTTEKGFFLGHIGVQAEKDNISYGLGYSYHKGNSNESNRFMANFNLHF